MKCKKAVIWSLVAGVRAPVLTDDDLKIESLMPLVETLFPGINYYSISGFYQVMNDCVIPTLKKLFPEFKSGILTESSTTIEGMVEISEFLPSQGFEWQACQAWEQRFQELLAI